MNLRRPHAVGKVFRNFYAGGEHVSARSAAVSVCSGVASAPATRGPSQISHSRIGHTGDKGDNGRQGHKVHEGALPEHAVVGLRVL